VGFVNPTDAFDFGICTQSMKTPIKSVCSYSSLNHFDGQNTIKKSDEFTSDFLISLLTKDNQIQIHKMIEEDEEIKFENMEIDLNKKKHILNGINFYDENQLMTWGNKVNIELYDLEKQKPSWKSKCGERDELNLVIPILNRDLCIDHKTSSLFVSNGLKTVKFYDISRQRKPTSKFEVTGKEDVRLDKIVCSLDGQYIYVTDVLGCLSVYDIRKTNPCLKRIRHSFACYSELIMSHNGNNLGTVGLDRYFRGYRIEGGIPHLVCERYLKTRLYSMFLEGDLDGIEEEDTPFVKKLGTGFVNTNVLEDEKRQEELHKKDKFDIEKVFPTRKEAIQIKLRNRIKRDIQDQMKMERKQNLKKVKTDY
jgi:WD40 repeat protein